MMVALIIATIALALIVGPFYEALGLTAGMGDRAENPLYAFLFLGMVIVAAVAILLLRKLLKKRRFKLKYVLAFAVLLSTMTVLAPFIDMAVNGVPELWDEYHFDVGGAVQVLPLDPWDVDRGILVITDTSFHSLIRGKNEYDEVDSVEGLQRVFEPFYKEGIWLVSCESEEGPDAWTVDVRGNIERLGTLKAGPEGYGLVGAQMDEAEDVLYIVSFWSDGENGTAVASPTSDLSIGIELELFKPGEEGPIFPINGWTSRSGNQFRWTNRSGEYDIVKVTDDPVSGLWAHAIVAPHDTEGIVWGVSMGDLGVLFTDPRTVLNRTGRPALSMIDPGSGVVLGRMEWNDRTGQSRVWASGNQGSGWKAFASSGDSLTVLTEAGRDTYHFTGEITSVFSQGTGDDIWVVSGRTVSHGELSAKERLQWWVQGLSFILSLGLVVLIMRRPKWWLIDLTGILMGAGVTALMGISFPLLFTMLLLVLLAGYDAVAVYKTKHMIALADSVVEAKMPILLVFPKRLSYRYEDEKDLMDPKRKGRALFMGLGDVIIPGILIVSAYTFLPSYDGAWLFGIIPPNLGVALFTMAGMLIGYAVLIGFVLKGKAHAGLPPLNGGSILMFLLGHLLLYGSLVFW